MGTLDVRSSKRQLNLTEEEWEVKVWIRGFWRPSGNKTGNRVYPGAGQYKQ